MNVQEENSQPEDYRGRNEGSRCVMTENVKLQTYELSKLGQSGNLRESNGGWERRAAVHRMNLEALLSPAKTNK